MKSVVLSAVLLVLIGGFCFFVKMHTVHTVDMLYELTEALPTEPASFERNDAVCREKTEMLGKCWSDAVGYFSYVCGYNALNRADEAIWNLYAAVGCADYSSAVAARYQLLDALRRMRELEGITLSSIF